MNIKTYDCPECGLSIDRDLNASINLRNAVSLTINICG
ncbi:MAG: transposase [Okeania sp. SIO2F4]|nr:transposase [Okeania sp. SIO2F4]